MKELILKELRENAPEAVSGEELSQRLGVSRTAVWKHIKQLRLEGYTIDSRPKTGYRLLASPDFLYPAEIKKKLKTRLLGREIRHYREVSSTNEATKELALQGYPEGLLVVAEEQTGGKGRLGRRWISPRGKGLWMSLLFRPPVTPLEAPKLTVLAAVAVAQVLQKVAGLPAEIKWPNDVLIRGKKVCGLLTELNAEMDRVNFIVMGIGVNVNLAEEDFPDDLKDTATSLLRELGQPVQRLELLQGILETLDEFYQQFLQGNYRETWEKWRRLSCALGRQVVISGPSWQVQGLALDVDEDGALLLELATGERRRFFSGEVSLRPIK